MNLPNDRYYTRTHEWVRFDAEGNAEVGLTEHAVQELGDLVFVNLPESGERVTAGEAFGDVESVKAVSDVYSPLSGAVLEANGAVLDKPEEINRSPYEAWLIRVTNIDDKPGLLSQEEYRSYTEEGDR